ncbi:zinc finger protein 43-like isoform X2 [Daktulosphaira vitifoliae]|nr:zinc finger protein 43-like isoform X2 [Daktulosphaira vitifoliae]XP_050545390.1 zinc finger protein 43-like isoform X2 [Daktulosphaira vitifoliae]XP_050545391.1 zinc finger protein 43-like isoform X2 [Daktulosphaira vitifoliae]
MSEKKNQSTNCNHLIKSILSAKWRNIDLDDNLYEFEDSSEYELPLSSIANFSDSLESNCLAFKAETQTNNDTYPKEVYRYQINSFNKTQYQENRSFKEYKCDICARIFKKRQLIIHHFKTSLCFPSSPSNFKRNSIKHHAYKTSAAIRQVYLKLEDNKNSSNLNYTTNNDKKDIFTQALRNVVSKNNHEENYINNNIHVNYLNKNKNSKHKNHLKNKNKFNLDNCIKNYMQSSSMKSDVFKCDRKLKNHWYKHEFEFVECRYCNKKFNYDFNLSQHIKKKHKFSKNYHCSECFKVFYKRSDIKMHIFKEHNNYQKFSCKICAVSFYSSLELSEHMKIHYSKNSYKCDVCPKSFNSSYRLYQHYQWHLGINHFKCQFCSKMFSNFSSYLSHERIHTGEKSCVCCVCKKRFKVISNLKFRSRIHMKCKPFITNCCLKNYLLTSKSLTNKNICSKEKLLNSYSSDSFNCSTMLNIHKNFTNIYICKKCKINLKPSYTCDICSKSFTQYFLLEEHQNIHINSNSFKCNLCHLILSDYSMFITHKKSHDISKIYQTEDVCNYLKLNENFKCNVCGMLFACSKILEEHTTVHIEPKLEKLQICMKNELENEIQTNIRSEFKCDLCNDIFNTQSQIVTHILSTHY